MSDIHKNALREIGNRIGNYLDGNLATDKDSLLEFLNSMRGRIIDVQSKIPAITAAGEILLDIEHRYRQSDNFNSFINYETPLQIVIENIILKYFKEK